MEAGTRFVYVRHCCEHAVVVLLAAVFILLIAPVWLVDVGNLFSACLTQLVVVSVRAVELVVVVVAIVRYVVMWQVCVSSSAC